MKGARLLFRRALDELDDVITAFPEDRWDIATPCTAWTARALAGHVVDGQRQVAGMLIGQPRPPVVDADELARIAGSAPVASWRAARRDIDVALSSVADDATVCTPLGVQTVEALLGTALVEPLVHSWDLGVAAGRSIELDADATRAVVDELEALGDTLAATGMYAPPRQIRDDMTAQERLLALTGRDPVAARQPAWSTRH